MQSNKDGLVIKRGPQLQGLGVGRSRLSQPLTHSQMLRFGATRPGLAHRPRPAKPAQPKGFSGSDRAVIAAGVFMAMASASFATFMLTTDHSHPHFNGAEHLTIFAQMNGGLPQGPITRVPGAPDDKGIDYTATGSIPGGSDAPPPPRYKLPSINAGKEEVVGDLVLRGVTGNVALVEGPGGIYHLEAGAEVPGGGRVLSIEWRQGKYVVLTTRGVIRKSTAN